MNNMRIVITLGVVMILGCSGGDVQPPEDAATGNDAANGGDAVASDSGSSSDATSTDASDASLSGYPSGPYGFNVGDVITNITWIGYPDDAADAVATTKPYVTYSLDDARKSGNKYLMLNLAESLCPGCQKSAGELTAGGPAVVAAGGVVVEILETTGFTTQATKTSLDAWINKYQLPITTVKDQDNAGTYTLTNLGGREHAYIIDLTTMKILQIISGDITGAGATSGGKGLTEMHTLLGK